MSEVYAITDLNGYTVQMRDAAAKSISSDNNDNLDEYISLQQTTNLVEEFCLGHDDNHRPLLDEDTNEKIFEEAALWIHSIGLAKLAAKDLIECAWDDKTNDMVFWAKENNTVEKKNEPNKRRKNKKNKRSDSGM
ncbi:hypothetical protein EB118_19620 [bacterium]|nr:hypothetical protein [bacterium]NDD85591.1 hypothetical protein [bacterium]NDG32272.1 hypothetical protein [bacterium]